MDLIAALEEHRKLTVEHAGMRFHLSVPTEYQMRLLWRRHGSDPAGVEAIQRDGVLAALTGWDGVTQGHILKTGHHLLKTGEAQSSAPVSFERGLAAAWLDTDLDVQDALAVALWQRLDQLRVQREGDAKN